MASDWRTRGERNETGWTGIALDFLQCRLVKPYALFLYLRWCKPYLSVRMYIYIHRFRDAFFCVACRPHSLTLPLLSHAPRTCTFRSCFLRPSFFCPFSRFRALCLCFVPPPPPSVLPLCHFLSAVFFFCRSNYSCMRGRC